MKLHWHINDPEVFCGHWPTYWESGGGSAMKARYPAIDWQRHKSVVIESDDWGSCTRTPAPNRDAFDQALPLWRQSGLTTWRMWSSASLETAEQMEQLFDVLRSFRGGDGRNVVFCPAYIVANPDFAAIRENDFSEYVEIPLNDGYPAGWERPGMLEKARDGIAEGLWYPLYHSRMHHYNGQCWVDILRSGSDPLLRSFFDLGMIGVSDPRNGYMGLEFEGMTTKQIQAHLAGGLAHFHDVFGFMPDCVALENIEDRSNHLVYTIDAVLSLLSMPSASTPETDCGSAVQRPEVSTLTAWLNRRIYLNPMGLIEREADYGADRAIQGTVATWGENRPAIISSHRANYTRLCEDEQMFSLSQLFCYLDTITTHHPDVVFLTSSEIAQIFQNGTSSVRFGDNIICRNYTGEKAQIEVSLPAGRVVGIIYDLATEATVGYEQVQNGAITFTAPDGDFCIMLG